MLIEIVGWSKFNNPRKDVKSTSWFRFQNDFFTDPDFCDMPHGQKWVFPYLCSVASAKMNCVIDVSVTLTCKILNISEEDLELSIKHLLSRGIIKIPTARKRHARVTDSLRTRDIDDTHALRECHACVTDSYRNGTDGTNERNERTDITDGTDSACARVDPQSSFGKFSPKELAQIWNELSSPKQPKVDLKRFSSGSKRWESAIARLKKDPDPEYWRSVITRLAASDFCNGESSSGWIANFDFLVSRDGHLKIMEGRYDNRAKPTYGAETCRVITEETNLDELC